MEKAKKRLKLKKFIFGTLLVFGLVFGATAVISMAEQVTVDGIDYTFSVDAATNTATITKVDPHDKTECNIPPELSGYPVKSIGNTSAESIADVFGMDTSNGTDIPFFVCNLLTKVTIPNGVESIGSFTFYGCQKLESVVMPSTVTTINYMAIYSCNKMQSLTIPHSVTSIGAGAFSCENLESVFIPNRANVKPLVDGTGDPLNTIVPESTIVYKYEILEDQPNVPQEKVPVKIVSAGTVDQESTDPVFCGAIDEPYIIRSSFVDNGVSHEELQHVEGKLANTCAEPGNIEYWKCNSCGKFFRDADGAEEIAESECKITVEHNLIHEDRLEPTTTEDGHIAGYTCSTCGKHFRDAAGTEEIPNDEWIIPKYKMGDINGDGIISILDLKLVFDYIAGKSELTEAQIQRADMNENGIVNILDLQALYNSIANT